MPEPATINDTWVWAHTPEHPERDVWGRVQSGWWRKCRGNGKAQFRDLIDPVRIEPEQRTPQQEADTFRALLNISTPKEDQ